MALEAGKSAHFTVALKLDKCSDITSVGLESSIEGTTARGPTLEVDVKPLARKPYFCNKRVYYSG